MIDWNAGAYETTAAELEPAAERVVELAGIARNEDVVDVACGTGNAALIAAARGARALGVDGAPRLLEVARERARALGAEAEFRPGDLQALPVGDDAADVVLSVFGLIFAQEPVAALREVARILRPDGRALVTAWIPGGPIDEALTAMGRIVARITGQDPRRRFAWFDAGALSPLAGDAGLTLARTTEATLPIRAASPAAYVAAGEAHPLAVTVRPVLERAGAGEEARDAMLAVLTEANEDPDAFLVHSPYVVHELRPA